MKALLVVLALSVSAVLCYPSKYDEKEWAMIPDGSGRLHLTNIKQLEHEASLMPRVETVARFLLYTRKNPTNAQELYQADSDGLKKSNFDASRPTRFIIHGFINDGDSEVNVVVRDAYLARGDYNVIVVDWSTATATINYIYARNEVPVAGGQCGRFIDFLNTQGVSFNDIYCVGHSLGAHVCGFCGKTATRGKINTIFGMDPALPLFDIDKPDERLTENDAVYVQSIQTDGGRLGFLKPIGQASFFPNWGGVQPGCLLDVTGTCSHCRSYKYFAESLKTPDNFVGEKCASFENIEKMKCTKEGTADMGGDPSNHNIKGVFYVPVNSKAPYGKGNVF
ncbi:unnamed protein product [Hermetia illucens]|uniref:Lipase domain-containing protein n=1 Tax=Hermetia illucens TaxID=343691 RepID=A0A7R8UEN5_HERIL|nr:pancreatic triacylglycerol lipase-like [Hermetia illucens]CAD7079314.1 unnamed protein product [Hermetia illucens]